jgi:hypothetical protein
MALCASRRVRKEFRDVLRDIYAGRLYRRLHEAG